MKERVRGSPTLLQKYGYVANSIKKKEGIINENIFKYFYSRKNGYA